MKHIEGCKAGWRITGCEACERAINSYDEMLDTLKYFSSFFLGDRNLRILKNAIAKAESR